MDNKNGIYSVRLRFYEDIGSKSRRKMRQRFEQQSTLGITPVGEIKFPLRSRDELPPVLKALQYIFVTAELNEAVFSLLENKITGAKKKTGRKGMDLWHILVLAVVRHTLGTNWDRIEDLSNNHRLIRQILGVHVEKFGIQEIEFAYQTIADNVGLIDEQLLQDINLLVVQYGHDLLKKKDDEGLRLKTDSYALETNIHFPTDLHLLWDSLRKGLDVVKKLRSKSDLMGWRKIKVLYKNIKSLWRTASQQVFRGGIKNEKQTRQCVQSYLQAARELQARFEAIINHPPTGSNPQKIIVLVIALAHYNDYVKKFIDQIDRRLLKGEQIGASEKVFSIFEPHSEWITKGKMHKRVELGHLLCITTDQHQFIVDYKVLENQRDASQVKELMQRLGKHYGEKKIFSHSFDKGFYSHDNYELLQQAAVENIVLPKKGKLNKEEKLRESNQTFQSLRRAHSAVESNINMLEHHGLNRCVDKGIKGYKRYVGLSVLAYNLHILGNQLLAVEKKKEQQRQKQRERYRQAA
ncbi:MAG: ISNCY family transposase [Chitinophagales bacterium]